MTLPTVFVSHGRHAPSHGWADSGPSWRGWA